MKIPTFDDINIGNELSRFLSIEISKEMTISMFNDSIKTQYEVDSAISANMRAYRECFDYDKNDAIESLARAIHLTIMKLRNKHCI